MSKILKGLIIFAIIFVILFDGFLTLGFYRMYEKNRMAEVIERINSRKITLDDLIGNGTANTLVSIYSAFAYIYDLAQAFTLNLPQLFKASLVLEPINNQQSTDNSTAPENNQNTENLNEPAPPEEQLAINDNQDLIDSILEKIDLLKRQIADLEVAELLKHQNQSNQNGQNNQIVEERQQENILASVNYISGGGGSGGSGGNNVYPKILISEFQVEGTSDLKEEFLELYNPNNSDVDLTGWYVHRRTKTGSSESTFASNTLFGGKKVAAKGYFLIARQGYFTNLADIFVDNPLTKDNSLFLKNPNGQIVDRVGWGEAQDYETSPAKNHDAGQSIGRKSDETDTDNNSVDFELDTPTPREKNITYVASLPLSPPPPPPPPPLPPVIYKILINEIQIDSIMGKGGTDDDWVELYNPNDVDVSLSGWSIQKHSSDDPCSIDKSFYKKNFTDDAVIPTKGFYLIVDTEAADFLKNMADMTIGWSLSDNNTIYLVRSQDKISLDDSNIVDKVGFGGEACFPETNSAPAPPETKSIERKKLGLDTDDNSADFKISEETTPKENFPKATIQDATDYSFNPSSGSSGAPVYNLLIKWQSSSTNIDFYQVQSKLNDSDWKDWLLNTTKTQENFQGVYSLLNDNVYSFRLRAQDKDGNLGSWSETIEIDLTNPVVINEVAYVGTNADSNSQWIELYNRTNKDIDLSGWKIVSGTNKSNTLNFSLKGKILPHSYFILERADDEVILDLEVDQIFEDSIGKNYLYLRGPNNRYIDEFYTSDSGLDEKNFIKNKNHYSMERVSTYSFGSFNKNWKLNNNGKIFNGKDSDSNQIYGTPGQENSVNQMYTYYSSSFIQDTTLKKDFSPYLLSGDVEVFGDINLSIEPGVVIKFYDSHSKLAVNGTLKAIGTNTDKIFFTSFADDEFGKDSNGNGDSSLPSPGDWLSLYFSKDSKNSQLENVVVRYGGAVLGFSPFSWGNAIWVDNSLISLKNSIVEKNKNRALVLTNSNSTVDSVKFLSNKTTDWPSGDQAKAVLIQGGNPEIKNSYFEDNLLGIDCSYFYNEADNTNSPTYALIENNTFVKNTKPIFWGIIAQPSFKNNQAADNTFNAIVFASDISKDMTLMPDLPYLIEAIANIPENVTLTLEPGVILSFKSDISGLKINGTLKAIGLPDKLIIFRSYYYDQDWIKPGDWLGLHFTKTSKNSELENIDVSYGGDFYGSQSNKDFTAAIKVDQSSISLKNSVVQKNANNGVWLINSLSVIDSVQFSEHIISTANFDAKAIYIQGGSQEVKNSYFKNNYYGIYIDNWHNDETGEDVLGNPVLDNNQFEGSIKADIFNINAP